MLLRSFRTSLGNALARIHCNKAQPRRLLQTINWDVFLVNWQPKAPSKFLKSSVASQIEATDAMIKDVHKNAAQMDQIMMQVRGSCQSIITTTRKEAREIMADAEQRTKEMKIELAKWEDEKKRIVSTHNFEPTIKLDIGGHVFITTLTTLTRFPDTMLGAMFSGRHTLKKNETGAHFIDRDGTYFREILNFLRSPESFDNTGFHGRQLRELVHEAEYYGLKDLMFPSTSKGSQESLKPTENALYDLCEEMNSMYGISEDKDTEGPTSLLSDMGRLDVEDVGNPLYDLQDWKSKLRYVVPHGEEVTDAKPVAEKIIAEAKRAREEALANKAKTVMEVGEVKEGEGEVLSTDVPFFVPAKTMTIRSYGNYEITISQGNDQLWYMQQDALGPTPVLVMVCEGCGFGYHPTGKFYSYGIEKFTTGRSISDAQPRVIGKCDCGWC